MKRIQHIDATSDTIQQRFLELLWSAREKPEERKAEYYTLPVALVFGASSKKRLGRLVNNFPAYRARKDPIWDIALQRP